MSGVVIGAVAGTAYRGARGFELWTRVLPASPGASPRSTAAPGVGATVTVR